MPGKDGQDGVPGIDGEKVGAWWDVCWEEVGEEASPDLSIIIIFSHTPITIIAGRGWSQRCPRREGPQWAAGECPS